MGNLIEKIAPPTLPPLGAYSQGVKIDLGDKQMVLVTGQLAADEAGQPLAPGDVEAQTHLVFKNIQTVLEAAGASLEDVVKAQIFLTDMEQFATVSAIRNHYFAVAQPVSTLVEINRTVIAGCDIEIEVMAIIDTAKT
ncbi:MAG: RidA family protein [Anaerolineae bacterium]|nr:RidA family protein [Anaerolineae bacterium]